LGGELTPSLTATIFRQKQISSAACGRPARFRRMARIRQTFNKNMVFRNYGKKQKEAKFFKKKTT
jgi:hypothetical protein